MHAIVVDHLWCASVHNQIANQRLNCALYRPNNTKGSNRIKLKPYLCKTIVFLALNIFDMSGCNISFSLVPIILVLLVIVHTQKINNKVRKLTISQKMHPNKTAVKVTVIKVIFTKNA